MPLDSVSVAARIACLVTAQEFRAEEAELAIWGSDISVVGVVNLSLK